MKPFLIACCILLIISCNKSEAKKPNCGCETDSIGSVAVDSVGWLSFDSASKTYLIHDTVEYGFLNIYSICNPEIKDISSINLQNDNAVAVYYSGKVKAICPDTLISLPEVFHYYMTIDSLRKQ